MLIVLSKQGDRQNQFICLHYYCVVVSDTMKILEYTCCITPIVNTVINRELLLVV